MKPPSCLLALLFCASLAWAQTDPYSTPLSRDLAPGFRTWTSAVGTTVDAKLVSRAADKVKLEKTDGAVIEVPLASLSADDQALVVKTIPLKSEPKSPAKPASPEVAEAPPVPADFPVDSILEIIPVMKKKKTQGVSFSFTDSITSRAITSNQLKGKYVYLHTLFFSNPQSRQLEELKLLHAKYASRGFEIVSINPYTYNSSNTPTRFTSRAVRENMRQAVADYDITWYISFPSDEGKNPLLEKLSDETQINWLLDPEGRLIHTNITSGGVITTRMTQRGEFLPLTRALQLIFGD